MEQRGRRRGAPQKGAGDRKSKTHSTWARRQSDPTLGSKHTSLPGRHRGHSGLEEPVTEGTNPMARGRRPPNSTRQSVEPESPTRPAPFLPHRPRQRHPAWVKERSWLQAPALGIPPPQAEKPDPSRRTKEAWGSARPHQVTGTSPRSPFSGHRAPVHRGDAAWGRRDLVKRPTWEEVKGTAAGSGGARPPQALPLPPTPSTFFFSRFRSFLSITPRICFMASVWTAPVPVAGC